MTRPLPIRALGAERVRGGVRATDGRAPDTAHTCDRRTARHQHQPSLTTEEPHCFCCMPMSFDMSKCRLHLYTVILTTISGCIIIGFVLYDLIDIAIFQRHFTLLEREDFKEYKNSNTGKVDPERKVDGRTLKQLKELNNEHANQEAMAIVLLLMLLLFILSGFAVYVGYKRRISLLFVPFLVLTFLILTFAMVYSILFKVEENTKIVYVKIITVVIIYTVLANVYRGVYRAYHEVRRENRRAGSREQHLSTISHTVAPVILQMKPPPYEKEPPPYSLTAPDISSPPYTPAPEDNGSSGSVPVISVPTYSVHTSCPSLPTDASRFDWPNPMTSSSPVPSCDSDPPPYSEPITTSGGIQGQGRTVTSHGTESIGHINNAMDLSDEGVTSVHL